MGILNVTPDSFSDGGQFLSADRAVAHGLQMAAAGADLIDIGGESTRPGSAGVPPQEELRRVLPVVEALATQVRIPLSVDTSKAEVAQAVLEAGASLINDVTALRGDVRMLEVVARAEAGLILMHMRGTPCTMQQDPQYEDVVGEVTAFLAEAVQRAEAAGVAHERILIDPGLGFGKTQQHNLLLLQHLSALATIGCPVVIGPSRKSFIGQTLNCRVQDRVAGTLACVAHAMHCGVQIVRVHDVTPVVHLLRMLDAIACA